MPTPNTPTPNTSPNLVPPPQPLPFNPTALRDRFLLSSTSPVDLALQFSLPPADVLSTLADPATSQLRNTLDLTSIQAAARSLLDLIHQTATASLALANNPEATQEQRRRVGTLNSTLRIATKSLTTAANQLFPTQTTRRPHQKTNQPTPTPTPKPTSPQQNSTPAPTPNPNPKPITQPHPLRDDPTWLALSKTLSSKQVQTALALPADDLKQLMADRKNFKKTLSLLEYHNQQSVYRQQLSDATTQAKAAHDGLLALSNR
jgi:hypothetical protein